MNKLVSYKFTNETLTLLNEYIQVKAQEDYVKIFEASKDTALILNGVKIDKPLNEMSIDELMSHYIWALNNVKDDKKINQIKDKFNNVVVNSFGNGFDPKDKIQSGKLSYTLRTMDLVNNYRTAGEEFWEASFMRGTSDLLRGRITGGLNSMAINYVLQKGNEVFVENVLGKPYNFYKDNIDLYGVRPLVDEDFITDEDKPKTVMDKVTMEVINSIEPKLSGVLKSYVKVFDRSESDYSLTIPSLFTAIPIVPFAPTLTRAENQIRRDPVNILMNTDKRNVDIMKFGISKKPENDFERFKKQLPSSSSIKMTGVKKTESELGVKKFGGN